LVGCNTDGIDQNLTQDLAKAIYNDTPELRTAEITGRKGDSIKTNNNAIIWMFVGKILGGLDWLADKVKILQQTYGTDSTDIQRIALVGCNTDGIDQNLKSPSVSVINCPSASKRTIMLLSGCLLARSWAALIAMSLLPF
jgi:hypothetical protein